MIDSFTLTAEIVRPSECEHAVQETALSSDAQSLPQTRVRSGLTLSQARDLLDWLEAHGVEQFEVDLDENDMICVTWNGVER